MTRTHGNLVFEITQSCNNDCDHCYNCWKNPVAYPEGQLSTDETLSMMGKILDESGARLVTLTGGEPLLRSDVYDIVEYLENRDISTNLITNGTLLTADVIERLTPDRISIFELPLLSVEREIHDAMSRAPGAFDKVTLAMANLKLAKQRVVGVFVATKRNLPTWKRTIELAVALGIDGIMFNRFNPGGRGREHVDELQATPERLQEALDIAEELGAKYEMPISCSIAMPPCLFDTEKYERLTFGYCAAGTERAYYTMDPLGNIRPCNHSPTILGNIRETGFWEMVDSRAMRDFARARPAFCAGCTIEDECLGGCKAAAETCSGSLTDTDPFVKAHADRVAKK